MAGGESELTGTVAETEEGRRDIMWSTMKHLPLQDFSCIGAFVHAVPSAGIFFPSYSSSSCIPFILWISAKISFLQRCFPWSSNLNYISFGSLLVE